jgi:hypothetical protein
MSTDTCVYKTRCTQYYHMYRHMGKYITKMYTIPLHVHTYVYITKMYTYHHVYRHMCIHNKDVHTTIVCIHNKDVHNTITCTDTCVYITKMYTIPSHVQTHV